MLRNERLLGVDDVVVASIGMESSLDVVKYHDGSISSSTFSSVDRETDGVVERQTEGRVRFLTTFTAIKQIGLEKLDRREQCLKR